MVCARSAWPSLYRSLNQNWENWCNIRLLAKEVRMSSSSHKLQFISLYSVDEEPAGIQMHFSVSPPDSSHGMVAISHGRLFFLNERCEE